MTFPQTVKPKALKAQQKSTISLFCTSYHDSDKLQWKHYPWAQVGGAHHMHITRNIKDLEKKNENLDIVEFASSQLPKA